MPAQTFLLVTGARTDAGGLAITLVGLLIVFIALILISLFIAGLPKLLVAVGKYWPEVREGHPGETHPESLMPDDDAILAAIGFVLHHEFQRQLLSDQTATKK